MVNEIMQIVDNDDVRFLTTLGVGLMIWLLIIRASIKYQERKEKKDYETNMHG